MIEFSGIEFFCEGKERATGARAPYVASLSCGPLCAMKAKPPFLIK